MLLAFATALGGCPIYSTPRGDNTLCDSSGGNCTECPPGTTPYNGECTPWDCNSSSDCPNGYSCTGYTCTPEETDASACNCGPGFICKLAGGKTECVVGGDAASDSSTLDASTDGAVADVTSRPDAADAARATDGSSDASAPDAGTTADAAPSGDAGTSTDAGTADVAPPPPPIASCNADSDCTAGDHCIDGACTPESALCSDGTQCVVAGSACVDGLCEPHCGQSGPGGLSVPCPAGYQCDFVRGVCNENPSPCTGSGTSSCLGGSTCVEGHCVAPCGSDDGASCPAGQLCIHGGCLPDQAATFSCKNDGNAGSLATTCDGTDICLHHDCYVACDPDAGAAACADPTAACIEVTVTAGTYLVCAAPSTMGSECDLAVGNACASGVCVNGFCK
jgi:hypothetical protein